MICSNSCRSVGDFPSIPRTSSTEILTTATLVALPLSLVAGVVAGAASFLTRRRLVWSLFMLVGVSLFVGIVSVGRVTTSVMDNPEWRHVWSEYASNSVAYGAAEGALRGSIAGALLACVIVTHRIKIASKGRTVGSA